MIDRSFFGKILRILLLFVQVHLLVVVEIHLLQGLLDILMFFVYLNLLIVLWLKFLGRLWKALLMGIIFKMGLEKLLKMLLMVLLKFIGLYVKNYYLFLLSFIIFIIWGMSPRFFKEFLWLNLNLLIL